MVIRKISFSYIILFSFLIAGCNDNKKQVDQNLQDLPEKQVDVPAFSSDSAYAFIEKQISFGPRVPNTTAHAQVAAYLTDTFKQYGAQVETQDFEAKAYNGTTLDLKNIIASFNPSAQKRILLAAHWDTRPFADKDSVNQTKPFDGANDGASGVAVLLEIARSFSNHSLPDVGIDMILFDGEDYGEPESYKGEVPESSQKVWWCLGSQYWAEHKHKPNYSAYYGILLDMVGARNARFYREGVSMNSAPTVVKKVWDWANQLGYQQYFTYQNGSEIVDDHIYVNYKANIPMIDIIEYNPATTFGKYHHTHADNIDIIDKNTLKAVGETLMHVIYHE